MLNYYDTNPPRDLRGIFHSTRSRRLIRCSNLKVTVVYPVAVPRADDLKNRQGSELRAFSPSSERHSCREQRHRRTVLRDPRWLRPWPLVTCPLLAYRFAAGSSHRYSQVVELNIDEMMSRTCIASHVTAR